MVTKTPLSFRQILVILKSCKDNGVASFKLGDLDINFHPRARSNVASQIEDFPTTKITESVAQAVETDEEVEEFKRAQELITNPEAFELDQIERATQE